VTIPAVLPLPPKPLPSAQPQLHYAPAPPRHRRRHIVVWLLALAAVLVLILSPRWAPLIWRNARLLYWQRKCMGYAPADNQPAMRYEPSALRVQAVVPVPWQEFMHCFALGFSRADATIFVHERISPGGHHRLVGLNVFAPSIFLAHNPGLQYEPVVIRPGGLFTGASVVGPYKVGVLLNSKEPMLIFPAVTDESDASHFSFECRQDSCSTIFDGWLRDDDSVVIEPRQPAPTPPAPPSTASSR
jgi:hypothetical protein